MYTKVKIVTKSISELKPYENNPRYNDEAVSKVVESIKEFGFKVPIVIDTNNTIIAGHTRYKAAIALEINDIPCIVADDLTPEQVQAFRLVDNKTAEFATWNFEKLSAELEELDIDMEQFGFPDLNMDLDVSDEDFFTDEPLNEKKKKSVICPYCGKEFEI